METVVIPSVNLLDALLTKLSDGRTQSVRAILHVIASENNTEEMANACIDVLAYENLATSESTRSIQALQITPYGKEILRYGGYAVLKSNQEAERKQREEDEELDRMDKRGSVEDREFNRRLAWGAIIISGLTALWTIISDVFIG